MRFLSNLFCTMILCVAFLYGIFGVEAWRDMKAGGNAGMVPAAVEARAYAEVWNEVEVAQIEHRKDTSWFASACDWVGLGDDPELAPLPSYDGYSRAAVDNEKTRIYNLSEQRLYTQPLDQKERVEKLEVLGKVKELFR